MRQGWKWITESEKENTNECFSTKSYLSLIKNSFSVPAVYVEIEEVFFSSSRLSINNLLMC